MSTPHRATAEEWAEISAAASNPSGEACSVILELRARVEALEAAQQLAGPAGSLVERVALRIAPPGCFAPDESYGEEARAAIREVAAWLRAGRMLQPAELLEQEAMR